ncbi:MAG: trypsin-like serine protease [Proteobacteria bacterium]|nr:trypsin-like serine protease [Pseudomonadota bacterium]
MPNKISNYRFSVCSVLILLSGINGCKAAKKSSSNLTVVNGKPVTKASEGPGTYAVLYERKNPDGTFIPIGNGSAVAVGGNTFITNAHVADSVSEGDRVRILDYQGKSVYDFNPKGSDVKVIKNDKYDGYNNDIAAFVLPNNLASDRLTQGIVPLAVNRPSNGDSVRLVGAGYADYNAAYKGDMSPESGPVNLRYGENVISEVGQNKQWIDGVAFKNDEPGKNSVSSPGDSGGGLITYDKNGTPMLVGLMTGGSQLDNEGNRYGPGSKPGMVSKTSSDGKRSEVKQDSVSKFDKATSYATDITQQNGFLEQVSKSGGNLEIPTYFNPNDQRKYSGNDMDGMNTMYGDAWKNSAIVGSSDNKTYSGYQNGSYKWKPDGQYQWHDKNGTPTESYAKYDTAGKSWSYQGAGNKSAPPKSSGQIGPSNTKSQPAPAAKPNVITEPPPNLKN